VRPHRYLPVLLLILCPLIARAQLGLYAEFSGAKANVPGATWVYGPTFGGYFDKGHLWFFSTGLDLRGAILGTGDNVLDSGLVGPRLAVRPHAIPIQPYVEGLVGVGHVGYFQGTAPTTVNKFEYQFVGGIDWTILPRLDWRPIEFSYGGLSGLGSSFNPKTISTGIVLRLP
jgi:hypothetical protein